MQKLVAALYVRLSREDLDNEVSQSIQNQINGLKDYCLNKDIKIHNIYVDDGYSGANFTRPAFTQMIKDLKKNKFNTLITKDVSRIGRNYLLVGDLLDNILPEYNVRYISVSENYDSVINKDDESILIRSVVNDYYLKEFKRKTKETLLRKAKTQYLYTSGIYGYKLSDKKKIVVDEVAAGVVRFIFDEFINGTTVTNITEKLRLKNVDTPGYHMSKNEYYKRRKTKSPNLWVNDQVLRILSNKEYFGAAHNLEYITHNGKLIKNPNPIIIEDAMPAIITKEIFEKSQELKAQYKKLRESKIDDNLEEKRITNFVVCKDCNKVMVYRRYGSSYTCVNCCKKIKTTVLHEILIKDATKLINEVLNDIKFTENFIKRNYSNTYNNIHNKLNELKKFIDKKYQILINKKVENTISKLDYEQELKVIRGLNTEYDDLVNSEAISINENDLITAIDVFKDQIKNIELTNDLEFIKKIIHKVYLDDNNKIKIKYKFERHIY